MVTLTLQGELAPRSYADVHCNGQPFCKMYMDKHGKTQLCDRHSLHVDLWELYTDFAIEPEAHGDCPEETLNKAQHELALLFAIVEHHQATPPPQTAPVTLDCLRADALTPAPLTLPDSTSGRTT